MEVPKEIPSLNDYDYDETSTQNVTVYKKPNPRTLSRRAATSKLSSRYRCYKRPLQQQEQLSNGVVGAFKITTQGIITYLVTGEQIVLTPWSKNGIDNLHDEDRPRVTSLMIRLWREKHPEYMSDADKLFRHRRQFLSLNRSLTATYSSAGLLTPSISNVCEYKSGVAAWTDEDWINQYQSEHRSRSFGASTLDIVRRESIDFVREYTSQNNNDGTTLEVYDAALSELRSISKTHANVLSLKSHYMSKCADAELENVTVDNAQASYMHYLSTHGQNPLQFAAQKTLLDEHDIVVDSEEAQSKLGKIEYKKGRGSLQLDAQKTLQVKHGRKVSAKDAQSELQKVNCDEGNGPLQNYHLKCCQDNNINTDTDGNPVTAKNATSVWMSSNNPMKDPAVLALRKDTTFRKSLNELIQDCATDEEKIAIILSDYAVYNCAASEYHAGSSCGGVKQIGRIDKGKTCGISSGCNHCHKKKMILKRCKELG